MNFKLPTAYRFCLLIKRPIAAGCGALWKAARFLVVAKVQRFLTRCPARSEPPCSAKNSPAVAALKYFGAVYHTREGKACNVSTQKSRDNASRLF
jgi:hypothetical protein